MPKEQASWFRKLNRSIVRLQEEELIPEAEGGGGGNWPNRKSRNKPKSEKREVEETFNQSYGKLRQMAFGRPHMKRSVPKSSKQYRGNRRGGSRPLFLYFLRAPPALLF